MSPVTGVNPRGQLLGGGIGGWLGMVAAVLTVIGPFIWPMKPKQVRGPAQGGSKDLQQSEYGSSINVCYGTNRMTGNMFWSTGIIEVATIEATGFGKILNIFVGFLGKGTGFTNLLKTDYSYSYYASFAIGLGEAPLETYLKVFMDGKVMLDQTGKDRFNAYYYDVIQFPGGEDQVQSQVIAEGYGEDHVGGYGDDTPAFKDLAFLQFDLLPLHTFGNRIPQVSIITPSEATPIFPYTRFEKADLGFGDIGPISEYTIDADRGYIYGYWSNIFGEDRFMKYDYIKGVTEWEGEMTSRTGSLFSTFEHSWITSSLIGRAFSVSEGSGDIIACGRWTSEPPPLPGLRNWIVKIDPELMKIVDARGYTGVASQANLIILRAAPAGGFTPGPDFDEPREFLIPEEIWKIWNDSPGYVRTGFVNGATEIHGLSLFLQYSVTNGMIDSGYNLPGWNVSDGRHGRDHTTYWGTTNAKHALLRTTCAVYQELHTGVFTDNVDIFHSVDYYHSATQLHGSDSDWAAAVLNWPYFWWNANWESDDYPGAGPFKAHTGPIMVYCREDDTLIIMIPSNTVGDSPGPHYQDWAIGKYDVGDSQMTVIKREADYNYKTSTAQFKLPETINWVPYQVITSGGTGMTWLAATYWTSQRLGISQYDGWRSINHFEYAVEDRVRLWDNVTMQMRKPGYQELGSWPGNYSYIISRGIQIPYRNSMFLGMAITPTDDGDIFDPGDEYPDPAEVFFDRYAATGTPLDEVVADMCRRTGLEEHQFDVTELADDIVQGCMMVTRGPVKANLQPLQLAYDFTYVESDWKIKFVKRGTTSSITVPTRDLGAGAKGKGKTEILKLVRSPESEKPMSIDVTYIDADRDYQSNLASYKRTVDPVSDMKPDKNSKEDTNVPMVLTPLEAATLAKVGLARQWTERLSIEGYLPQKYLGLDPTDVITLTGDDDTHLVAVDSATIGGNLVMELKAVQNEPSVFDLHHTAIEGDWEAQIRRTLLKSYIIAIDTPILRDADLPSGTEYALYCGFKYARGEDFPGARAYIGDSVEDEHPWFGFSGQLDNGKALNVLGRVGLGVDEVFGSDQVTDVNNTVDISMSKGTLSSADNDEDFYSGFHEGGGAKGMLGKEVIQAKTVTTNADGTYTLSNLLRGRRGTEWAISSHGIGERWVSLYGTQPFAVTVHPAEEAIGGVVKSTRAVTRGWRYGDVPSESMGFSGNSLRPLAPVTIEGARSETAGNNITVRWIRRNRIHYEWGWGDGEEGEIQMTESSETYSVDLLDKDSFDPDVYLSSKWISIANKTANLTFVRESTLSFTDNGDRTATVSDTLASIDFREFVIGSWVELQGFGDDDMNTFAVVLGTSETDIDLKIPDAGTDTENIGARIIQMPTHATFSEAEITEAGYDTSEPLDIIVRQISGVIGKGYSGFDPNGVDR